MKTAQIISSIMEAADLDRGHIGIELELLIRKDLAGSKSLTDLLYEINFMDSVDGSIEKNTWSKDVFYKDFETNNDIPCKWSELKPRLIKLLSWLKREDVVDTSKDGNKTWDKLVTSKNKQLTAHEIEGGLANPDSWRKAKLPRGKIPNNASAGLHIHFDANDWFDGVEHARNFVDVFNRIGKQTFKPAVHPARYPQQGPTETPVRGNDMANWGKLKVPDSNDPRLPYSSPNAVNRERRYFSLTNAGKYMAMNCKSTLTRGDVEFRFMHGTLNFSTIEGWLKTLAEMIEFSRTWKDENSATQGMEQSDVFGRATKGKFDAHLSKEAPDTAAFLRNRSATMTKAKPEVSNNVPYRQSRAVNRHAKMLTIQPPKPSPGAVRTNVTPDFDPNDTGLDRRRHASSFATM